MDTIKGLELVAVALVIVAIIAKLHAIAIAGVFMYSSVLYVKHLRKYHTKDEY